MNHGPGFPLFILGYFGGKEENVNIMSNISNLKDDVIVKIVEELNKKYQVNCLNTYYSLREKLEKLERLFSSREGKSSFINTNKMPKFLKENADNINSLFQRNRLLKGSNDKLQQNYQEAFRLINEILNILRGISLKILIARRVSVGGKTVLKTFEGEETELKYSSTKHSKSISYLMGEIEQLKKQEQKVSFYEENYFKHYESFLNIAHEGIGTYQYTTKNGTVDRYKVNEGQIYEAYNRHLRYAYEKGGHLHNFESEDYRNEPFDVQEIFILIYYTLKAPLGWWEGGDIGMLQVKLENTKLASKKSIRFIGTKILEMFSGEAANMSLEKFEKIFNKEQIDEMKMTSLKKDQILEEIRSGKKSWFDNNKAIQAKIHI